MKPITLDYNPQEKQRLLHESKAKQIFYGGAAGGGKSHSLRWDAITFCLQNPGLDAFLFRRTLGELEDNHIRRITQEIPRELGHYRQNKNRFEFTNGSGINFCYCEREKDVERYQGAEIHWLGVDEASHLTEYQLTYLRGRVRLGGFKPKQPHLLPRIVFSSNPGNVGHDFLKRTFIEPSPPQTYFHDSTMADPANAEDRGWLSIYIPARMSDNEYLESGYAGQFQSLPPEMARALTEGDWDAVVGAALHNLSKERHRIRAFEPPRHWTKFMSMDWGTARPFSVGWYCVSDGAALAARDGWPEVDLPSGAIIRYNEWYGWDGRTTNSGCRMESQRVAREILRTERERDELMDYRVGDYQMWAQSDGPSPAENMLDATNGYFTMIQAKKDRKSNYTEFISRLAGNPDFREDGTEDIPMFYITENCLHFWRTCPILTLDNTDPEKGPDTKLEDHVYDEVCYALRSRPFVTTEYDRWFEEHKHEMRRHKGVDPYATV